MACLSPLQAQMSLKKVLSVAYVKNSYEFYQKISNKKFGEFEIIIIYLCNRKLKNYKSNK